MYNYANENVKGKWAERDDTWEIESRNVTIKRKKKTAKQVRKGWKTGLVGRWKTIGGKLNVLNYTLASTTITPT